jgi:glycosyltransferase involved in cell wall biosynthesis
MEIIVVDDGSDDATASIAKEFGDRIRFMQPEQGRFCST